MPEDGSLWGGWLFLNALHTMKSRRGFLCELGAFVELGAHFQAHIPGIIQCRAQRAIPLHLCGVRRMWASK